MEQNNHISEELKQIAPKLAAINKENNPFKVPENYFSTLPERIRKNTVDTKRVNPSVLEWINFYLHKPAFIFSTLFLLIACIAGVYYNLSRNFNVENELIVQIKFSDEELENYITCNLHNYYDSEIIENYNHITLNNGLNFETDENFLDSELESFIINNINENLIMEEML